MKILLLYLHQNGVGEARRLQIEQCAESAQPADDARPRGGACQWLDCLHQGIACLDVHPGRAVGGSRRNCVMSTGHGAPR